MSKLKVESFKMYSRFDGAIECRHSHWNHLEFMNWVIYSSCEDLAVYSWMELRDLYWTKSDEPNYFFNVPNEIIQQLNIERDNAFTVFDEVYISSKNRYTVTWDENGIRKGVKYKNAVELFRFVLFLTRNDNELKMKVRWRDLVNKNGVSLPQGLSTLMKYSNGRHPRKTSHS